MIFSFILYNVFKMKIRNAVKHYNLAKIRDFSHVAVINCLTFNEHDRIMKEIEKAHDDIRQSFVSGAIAPMDLSMSVKKDTSIYTYYIRGYIYKVYKDNPVKAVKLISLVKQDINQNSYVKQKHKWDIYFDKLI